MMEFFILCLTSAIFWMLFPNSIIVRQLKVVAICYGRSNLNTPGDKQDDLNFLLLLFSWQRCLILTLFNKYFALKIKHFSVALVILVVHYQGSMQKSWSIIHFFCCINKNSNTAMQNASKTNIIVLCKFQFQLLNMSERQGY